MKQKQTLNIYTKSSHYTKDAPPPVIIKGVDAEITELDSMLEDVRMSGK